MSDEEAGDQGNEVSESAVVAADGNRDFTEVTNESYCAKMGNAMTGVCFGFLLFFGSIGLLIYNEGRTVKRAKDIDEGMEVFVELNLADYTNASSIPTEFENKLVYAFGELSTVDSLVDPVFGVGTSTNDSSSSSSNDGKPLKLSRSVEMYQWVESSSSRKVKTAGGGTRTETTYSYRKDWSSNLIDSSAFRDPNSNYTNPTKFPFEDLVLTADPIKLGGITILQEAVVSRLNWYEAVDSVSTSSVPDTNLQAQLSIFAPNGFYYHSNTAAVNTTATVVGDTRISFYEVPPDTISIVALFRSSDESLGTYTTSSGGTLLLVKRGTFTAAELFQQADDENTTTAWILRFVGFFLMVVSILLVLQPIATAVDIIPFLGDYLQGGLERCLFPAIAFLIALPISLFTISLAWLAYRPMWSVPILLVSACLIAWLYFRAKKAKQDADEIASQTNDDSGLGKPPNSDNTTTYQNGPNSNYNSAGSNYASGNYGNSVQPVGGFAGALDNPPPTAPVEQDTIPIVEPDVVMGQPYKPSYQHEEPDVNVNQPFVPQVYKP